MKTESIYIMEFNLTGNCVVDVKNICKDWTDKFVISTWKNENETEYTLQIFGKKKDDRLLKLRISEEQAKENNQ